MAADPDDLALALELAEIADSITRERFRAGDLVVETKPDLTPVTEADTAVEQALRDRLAVVRPEDSVVGEEYGPSTAAASSRRWILDPIDGTKNYVRGIPVWATLVALQEGEQITVGVVSAPALERRWWASEGGGAHATDGLTPAIRELAVSAVSELSDAQLCFAGIEEWEQVGRLDALLGLARSCWRTRGFGDFWQYMLVAEGVAEIALDPVVSVWDLAAPMVIVAEAGGCFTDLGGAPTPDGGDAIATNGLLHEGALAIVGRSLGEREEEDR
jgi:histidinol-phosphatase